MGKSEDRPLPGGGFERIHYGSDGRPNGRREYINGNNHRPRKEYEQWLDSVHSYNDPGYRDRCTCGGTYEDYEYKTRESNNWLGIGKKGTARGRKCSDCGRKEV